MLTRVFLTRLLSILLSCKKENDRGSGGRTSTELLTLKPRILSSHGFDDNRNHKIDDAEESIQECQKENITHFYRDGTGLSDDHTISCGTGIDKKAFTWVFTHAETRIDFLYNSVKKLRLTYRELILCKELVVSNNEPVKFIVTYKH
jgi:hypothetical protein